MPDVDVFRLKNSDNFIVVASDGLTNVLSTQSIIGLLRDHKRASTLPLADGANKVWPFNFRLILLIKNWTIFDDFGIKLKSRLLAIQWNLFYLNWFRNGGILPKMLSFFAAVDAAKFCNFLNKFPADNQIFWICSKVWANLSPFAIIHQGLNQFF